MHEIRTATYDEFVEWYLRREVRKAEERHEIVRADERKSLDGTAEQRRHVMRRRHPGKLRHWFEMARWRIVQVDSLDELEPLMIVAKAHWDGIQGAMPRFLGEAARHLRQQNYFSHTASDRDQLQTYYRQFAAGGFDLVGDDRGVIVTLEASHEWPPGSLYVHDGCGRLLAYVSYLRDIDAAFRPVEAFHAEPT